MAARSVLLIAHDPWLREEMGTFLSLEGYRVSKASNGSAGLRIAEREHPNAVIISGTLPEIGTAELIGLLRSRRDLRNTRVLVLNSEEKLPSDVALVRLPEGQSLYGSDLGARIRSATAPRLVEAPLVAVAGRGPVPSVRTGPRRLNAL
jgi:CheY-like chemotaxis protein